MRIIWKWLLVQEGHLSTFKFCVGRAVGGKQAPFERAAGKTVPGQIQVPVEEDAICYIGCMYYYPFDNRLLVFLLG